MKQFPEIPLITRHYGDIAIHQKVNKMLHERIDKLLLSIDNSPLSRSPLVQSNYYSRLNMTLLEGVREVKYFLDDLNINSLDYIPICSKLNNGVNHLLKILILEEQKYLCHNLKDIYVILITNIYTEVDIEVSKGLIDRHIELFNDKLFEKLKISVDKFYSHQNKIKYLFYLSYLNTLRKYWQSKKGHTRVLERSRM